MIFGTDGEGEGIEFGGEAVLKTVLDSSRFGKLTGVEINVSEKGLEMVRNHLLRPEFLTDAGEMAPENQAMLTRLQAALNEGRRVADADASFYMHELHESTLMNRGIEYDVAHQASLNQYGVNSRSLYAPEVIQAFPESFNASWFEFWNLPEL